MLSAFSPSIDLAVPDLAAAEEFEHSSFRMAALSGVPNVTARCNGISLQDSRAWSDTGLFCFADVIPDLLLAQIDSVKHSHVCTSSVVK